MLQHLLRQAGNTIWYAFGKQKLGQPATFPGLYISRSTRPTRLGSELWNTMPNKRERRMAFVRRPVSGTPGQRPQNVVPPVPPVDNEPPKESIDDSETMATYSVPVEDVWLSLRMRPSDVVQINRLVDASREPSVRNSEGA
jgi:hypothetical protein